LPEGQFARATSIRGLALAKCAWRWSPGSLILGHVSRLDAFSAYHFRT